MSKMDTSIKWYEAKVTDAQLLPGLRSGDPVYTAKDTTGKWLVFARSAWYALTPEEAKVSLHATRSADGRPRVAENQVAVTWTWLTVSPHWLVHQSHES